MAFLSLINRGQKAGTVGIVSASASRRLPNCLGRDVKIIDRSEIISQLSEFPVRRNLFQVCLRQKFRVLLIFRTRALQ